MAREGKRVAWSAALAMFVGGAGASVVTMAHWRRSPSELRRAEPLAAPTQQPSAVIGPSGAVDQERMAALESRIRALEAQPPAGEAASAPKPEPSPDDGRLEQQKMDEMLRARYEGEHSDPEWAIGAASSIRDRLNDIAKRGTFAVGEVDCKTTMCTAKFKWPSYSAARREFGRVLGLRKTSCSTEIYVPQPDEAATILTQGGDEPYEATLMLDCENWRTGTL